MTIAIILGSTRPGRTGESVAQWVAKQATDRTEATYELVDLKDYDLDLLDDPTIPGAANREYASEKTRAWSRKIDSYDGFVFVTPEYNHGVPAAFKNAVDVIYPEWNDKAVAFVAYGADGGVRAVEQWRQIVANLHLHATRAQLSLSSFLDFEDGRFAPTERRDAELAEVFNQVERLAGALQPLRG